MTLLSLEREFMLHLVAELLYGVGEALVAVAVFAACCVAWRALYAGRDARV